MSGWIFRPVGVDADKDISTLTRGELCARTVGKVHIVVGACHDDAVAALLQKFLQFQRHSEIQFILRAAGKAAGCPVGNTGLGLRSAGTNGLLLGIALALMDGVDHDAFVLRFRSRRRRFRR